MNTHPLQTTNWASFRKEWGNEVVETPYGYLTIHHLPFTSKKIGMFIKGPTPTPEMLGYLKNFAKENNLVFIKLEPNVAFGDSSQQLVASGKVRDQLVNLLIKNGAVPGKTLFTPTTFWIDLTKSEEELLASFHPKTRYNIRYAQRNGVMVEEASDKKSLEKYLSLMKETVIRDKFFAHNQKYHRLMWQHLKDKIAHLLVAKFNGEVMTAWILLAYDGFLYYPYGASTHKYKNVMASNLMMWEAIKLGKRLGLKTFDLWGREPGKGFTKFKEGYNPEVIEFLGTWDLVVNKPAYHLYRIAEKVRWLVLKMQAEFGLTKYRF